MANLTAFIVFGMGCCLGAWLTMGGVFWLWMEMSLKLDDLKGEQDGKDRNRF